jgi:diacylglycerol O-acyltransferase
MFNLVISNVPGPKDALYLNGAHLDEVYPASIPTHYLALNITISGYGDNLGFGYIACRRSVPACSACWTTPTARFKSLKLR